MKDCIIIGGGLIGMLSARELKKAGRDVLLLEKGGLGQESSWAGGGILSPLHPWRYADEINQLAMQGHRLYPQIAQQLQQESGVDPEYQRSGMLVWQTDASHVVLDWAKRWQMPLERVDAKQVAEIQPGLSGEIDSAYWFREIGQMRNPRLMRALKGSLQALGVEYRERTEVLGLSVSKGQIKGVEIEGKTLQAKQVLVAGGAWSAQILQGLSSVPDIKPVKGQMIVFKAPENYLSCMVLSQNRYLIPRRDGHILCGSTLEHTGFEKTVSDEIKAELVQSASQIMPGLAQFPIVNHWAGLRPGSPEGMPYIGPHPQVEGLFINAGHFRNGVILGIGSVQKLLQSML